MVFMFFMYWLVALRHTAASRAQWSDRDQALVKELWPGLIVSNFQLLLFSFIFGRDDSVLREKFIQGNKFLSKGWAYVRVLTNPDMFLLIFKIMGEREREREPATCVGSGIFHR